jgi:hypothetical protein
MVTMLIFRKQYHVAYPKSLHSKEQEGAEYCEDNSNPHWNLKQYIECKSCAQHCSSETICYTKANWAHPKKRKKLIVYWSTFRDVIRYHCKLRDDPQANVDETRVLFPAEFSKMSSYTKLTNSMNLVRLCANAEFNIQRPTRILSESYLSSLQGWQLVFGSKVQRSFQLRPPKGAIYNKFTLQSEMTNKYSRLKIKKTD